MKLLLRWAFIAISLFAAAYFVDGIRVSGNGWFVYAAMAAILSIANMLIRPILKFFSFPLMILTLGLFTFVLNAIMLWLSSYIAVHYFQVGFYVDGFIPALLGSLVVSVVSTVLSWILESNEK